MKQYLFITLSLCMSLTARADFNCLSHDGNSKLLIENHTDGQTATITLTTETTKKVLQGSLSEKNGGFMSKIIFKLSENNGTLTLTSQPQFCGRASCSIEFSTWNASLKIHEEEAFFSCDETVF